MFTLVRRITLAALLAPLLALAQGSQPPRFTVATLPAAASYPHYSVLVIDGANSTDCAVGGGANNVACVNLAGSWVSISSVSPKFTGTVTVNSAPTYSVNIGPLSTMTASWNFDTTTAASACASIGCSTGGGTVTTFAAPSGSWPAWLVPTVTNSTTAPSLAVASSTIPVSYGGTGTTSSTGSGSVVLSTSPALTGTPTAPTASPGTNNTQVATTAFVSAQFPAFYACSISVTIPAAGTEVCGGTAMGQSTSAVITTWQGYSATYAPLIVNTYISALGVPYATVYNPTGAGIVVNSTLTVQVIYQ